MRECRISASFITLHELFSAFNFHHRKASLKLNKVEFDNSIKFRNSTSATPKSNSATPKSKSETPKSNSETCLQKLLEFRNLNSETTKIQKLYFSNSVLRIQKLQLSNSETGLGCRNSETTPVKFRN